MLEKNISETISEIPLPDLKELHRGVNRLLGIPGCAETKVLNVERIIYREIIARSGRKKQTEEMRKEERSVELERKELEKARKEVEKVTEEEK